MGRNEEAEKLLREILDAYPDRYDTAYSLGLLLGEMERYEEAATYLRQASDGIPERGRAHYNLGLVLDRLGRRAQAEGAFIKALAVEPENLDYLYALADHYVRRGELERALELADRMTESHPENPLGRDFRANIERARNDSSRR
jgi:tetratricopeptide (TPR) repeat protein